VCAGAQSAPRDVISLDLQCLTLHPASISLLRCAATLSIQSLARHRVVEHEIQGDAMNLRAFALALALVYGLLAGLAMLNWSAFTAPSALSLGFAEISAPLGMVMLVFNAVISGLFVVYIVFQQAGFILEARRFAKEIKAERELGDKAEASRITELRTLLEGELRRIEAQRTASNLEYGARIEQAERGLQNKLEEATRTVSALLGEIEDKLDRVLVPTPL
jgi:uncharacterized integral membrane protein